MSDKAAENSRIYMDGLKPSDVALIRDVAELAAEKGIKAAFVTMGLDPENPLSTQRDMEWLRRARKSSEGIQGRITTVIITMSVTGAATAFWLGLKAILSAKTGG